MLPSVIGGPGGSLGLDTITRAYKEAAARRRGKIVVSLGHLVVLSAWFWLGRVLVRETPWRGRLLNKQMNHAPICGRGHLFLLVTIRAPLIFALAASRRRSGSAAALDAKLAHVAQPSVEKSSAQKSAYTHTPSIIVACIIVATAAPSIWYLIRPEPLLIQGEVDATRLDLAAAI
jgi:hypothetical protein